VTALTTSPTVNKRVGGILLQAKVISAEQYEAALKEVEGTPERIEDTLLYMGVVSEADLLKALAAHHKTRFVSAEKLAKAEIVRATLEMVPRRVAETFGVFPVMFDAAAGILSVVTADPDDTNLLKEIQLVSGAREVRPFVGRPAAVRAAIAKAYGGDIHAFAILDRAAQQQFQAMLNVYERNLVSDTSMATSLAREPPRERVISERDMNRTPANTAGGGPTPSVFGGESMLELLNVMVSLLENTRADLRGHSALVARLMRRVVERINLPAQSIQAGVAAAYLHDVGKMGHYHLTTLNCSEYDGHKLAAQKAFSTPVRLLEGVRLSNDTVQGLLHMYERYDGKGFPDALSGKDIPLVARVLAITDTYADLTQNPRNPYRKILGPAEATDVLAKYKGSIFDPHLVDLFKSVVMGDDVRARLLANRPVALLVDSDPEETVVLELRMIDGGFEVKTARSAEQALKILATKDIDIDLVVSELDLPQADGLTLLAEARKHPWGKDLPWVVHTRRQARADATKAFEHGVLDFVAKPAPTDVLVAKLKAMLDQRTTQRAARGVSGSLREMSLPDMIQVLFHGRKSGNLKIRSGSDLGEIHMADGNVVNALYGKLRGEDAFYAMLRLQDGEFGLDPQYKPASRVIHQSCEALLLEGMRRLDEGIA
jgi:response regulator RpfG family c-di-GMP phosphodiesterase